MNTLIKKKIVILGGSSGIGLATAKAAAEEGANVVIVSGNQNKINTALKLLPENAEGIALDLSNEKNAETLFSNIGSFDHLVYTAAENLNLKHVADTNLEAAKDFFTLRFWGALAAIKYATPYINKDGSINLISGTAGQKPGAGWALASAICGAVDGLTKAMAVELAPVRVNAIAPGVVATNLWDSMEEEHRNAFYTNTAERLLLKRIGTADDVATAFLFLMKEKYITGQVITVDGGTVLV